MRPDRDIDVLLDAWLAEGPLEAPDRILDVVADRVHRRHPEPAWRLAWRDSRMNTAIKPILAAAAVLVLSLAGVAVIMNQPSPDIGGPEATPSPIASPSPSSSGTALCQPTDPSCLGPLAAGIHQTDRIITPFAYEVPEGWSRVQEKPGYLALERPGETGIVFISADPVAVDQELCSSKADASVGTSAEDLVRWLVGHPGLTATEPATVSLGGLNGWTLEAEMRDGWDPFPCPLSVNLFSHDGTAVEDDMWWQIAAERMRLTILDAGDHTVMIDVEADKAGFAALVEAATSIVESIQFRSPSPGDAALCQPTDPSCRGPLAAGIHQTDRIITPFAYEVPEGWAKPYDEPGVVSLDHIGWAGFLGIWPDPVAVDQEVCTSNADPSVGRSVEDLVAWLTQHPGLTTTEPVRAELGGLGGWTLEAEMRDGWEPGPCPGRVNLFSHSGTEISDLFWWDIDADRRMRLTILDAGDHVVMVDVEADKADFDAVVAEAAPVVESFDFE